MRDKIYPKIHALIEGDYSALAQDAIYDCCAPFDRISGKDTIIEKFYQPLLHAFPNCYRRDVLFIGGENIRDRASDNSNYWVASVTHYVGNFCNNFSGDFLNIAAHDNHVMFLRSGEFYRIENDEIIEAKILLDLPNLLAQCGKNPFPLQGSEIIFPAPATQDGILPRKGDGKNTIAIMEKMFANLGAFNPQDFSSVGQTGTDGIWHEKMMWYGPTGIGSNHRWEGFVQDHRRSFLMAFPDRKGGNHYCRIGDGYYSAASGWPSMTMTFQYDYLGIKPDEKIGGNNAARALTLRVMDFYRCDDSQICENWVHLDLVDLARQMGKNILG
ncbi:MAG: ester cyclase [Alphaproteobacteria bacterium]|nr:ester cyclase [Alphaproteobacteria bacterium]